MEDKGANNSSLEILEGLGGMCWAGTVLYSSGTLFGYALLSISGVSLIIGVIQKQWPTWKKALSVFIITVMILFIIQKSLIPPEDQNNEQMNSRLSALVVKLVDQNKDAFGGILKEIRKSSHPRSLDKKGIATALSLELNKALLMTNDCEEKISKELAVIDDNSIVIHTPRQIPMDSWEREKINASSFLSHNLTAQLFNVYRDIDIFNNFIDDRDRALHIQNRDSIKKCDQDMKAGLPVLQDEIKKVLGMLSSLTY